MVSGLATAKQAQGQTDAQFLKLISDGLRKRAEQKFKLRNYQKPLWNAMLVKNFTKAYCLWHRGAGKDITCLNIMIEKLKKKPGTYIIALPTYSQGTKVIWDAIDNYGKKFLSYFPENMITRRVQDEMKLEFSNGSFFQVVGTENLEKLRGVGIDGLIMSEDACHNPNVWFDILEPAIRKKTGWVIFQTTPQGKNHSMRRAIMAQNTPDWFYQKLTIENTFRDAEGEDGRRLITDEEIDKLRVEGTAEDKIQREYYCSFEGGLEGSYYFDLIVKAEKEGRITSVPHIPLLPVYTIWDIGMSDSTAIWFLQLAGQKINVIDFYQAEGEQFSFYAKIVKEKPYCYESHLLPHDMSVREMGAGCRYNTLRTLGINPIQVLPKGVQGKAHAERVDAIRNILSLCYFDSVKTQIGVDALREEHKEYNELMGEFKPSRVKSWANHPCDAFGDFGLWYFRNKDMERMPQQTHYQSNFSVYGRN